MATICLVCDDPDARRKLALLAGEAGHAAYEARGLQEATDILRERQPRLMLVADGPERSADLLVREARRLAPLMPVVAALGARDAGRAVDLMRAGVSEVIAPPWTPEDMAACLSKALHSAGTAMTLAPRPPRRAWAAYALAVGAFLAVALGAGALKRQERLRAQAAAVRHSWELPYAHPAAMAFEGGDLWVLDWFTQSIYVHEADGARVKRVMPFPSESLVAIAAARESFWTLDAAGTVERRMKDAKLRVVQSVRRAAPRAVSLAYDGIYLWTLDASKKVLRKHLTDADLTVIAVIAHPGAKPTALVFDGHDLWSLDQADRALLRHNLERPEEITLSVPLPEYHSGGRRPVAAAWDGARWWTASDALPGGPAKLFRHPSP